MCKSLIEALDGANKFCMDLPVAGFVGADAFDDVQLFEFLDVAPDGGAVFFQGLCQSVVGYIHLLLYSL